MNINFDNVSFKYIEKPILKDASFSISENDKIGIIGVNGTGKTTLLKLIYGTELPNKGVINKSGGIRINYLEQDSHYDDNISLLNIIMKESTVDNPIKEYEATSILSKLGFDDPNITVKNFSGGQLKRLSLAKVLVTPCDFLILDEPTNHLDNETIMWLEKYLIKFKKAIIMVTHDRYFLERVCTKMLELDHGNTYMYDANYSRFLELKAERIENEKKAMQKLKSILRTEKEWMNRGVEARRTKSKARIERFNELSKIKFNVDNKMEISSVSTRIGSKLISIKNGSKSFGDKLLFDNFNFELSHSDIIGVIGSNGCGKTTLFKILLGEEELTSGIIDRGETLKIGYFSQTFNDVNPDLRVIDFIKNEQNLIETLDGTLDASEVLERFLFDKELQYSKIGMLSGGEKKRLMLVNVLIKNPNMLLLDEPTNDLDIYTLELLEDYLINFKGPIMVVSHDRYFLDKICNRLLVINDKKITESMKSFSEYLAEEKEVKKEVVKGVDTREKRKTIPYAIKKEFEALEIDINKLDERMSFLKSELNNSSNDYVKLMDYQKELDTLSEEYDIKSLRYLEILELMSSNN